MTHRAKTSFLIACLNKIAGFYCPGAVMFVVATAFLDQVVGQSITLNTANVISDVTNRPLGINVNYLMDDDTRIVRARRTSDALRGLRVGYLRYPGGEKSDNYLWSVAPFSGPDITAARKNAWPASDTRFFANGVDGKPALLDFDEFIGICRQAGAEPVVVICFDGMYKPSSDNQTAPTKSTLKQTAVEWVRYANVTRKYNVRYWTLGNETDYGDSYAGSNPGSSTFGADVAEFAGAMKAIDSTIKIGVNGKSQTWFTEVLARAASQIDYLEVHSYPTYNYTSYDGYRNGNPSVSGEVDKAVNAINALISKTDRDRLFVSLTEYNAIYWGAGTGWQNLNDLGHALAVFDITGQLMTNPKVKFSMLWNTRWVDNDVASLPTGAGNLFANDNGGFESGTSGWQVPSGASLTDVAANVHSGSKALELKGADDQFAYTDIPAARITKGRGYTFKVWGKVSSTSTWTGAGIDFLKQGSKVEGFSTNLNSSTYKEFSKPFLAPSDFDNIRVYVYRTGGSSVVYVDDFSVTDGALPSVNDALDRDGNLNPTGMAVAMWGQYLREKMVQVSGTTTSLRAFACKSGSGSSLSIYLINKGLTPTSCGISVQNYAGEKNGSRYILSGAGHSDLAPKVEYNGSVAIVNGSVSVALPAVSVNILDFEQATAMIGKNRGPVEVHNGKNPKYDLRGALSDKWEKKSRVRKLVVGKGR